MAKFNFNLKDVNGSGEVLILLVIRWNHRRLRYSTREYIEPRFWEGKKHKRNFQRAKETREYVQRPEMNARLDWIMSTAKNVFRKFLNDNENRQPEIDELKKALDVKLRAGETDKDQTFYGFIEQFIEEAKTRVNDKTGKTLAKATIGIYKNALATLRRYAVNRRMTLDFKNIDLDFYYDYTSFLAKSCGYSNNYIGKQVKMLKTFLHDATERGVNTNPAFRSRKFKAIAESTTSIFLNEAELEEMYNLDLSDNPRLERARSLFLVGSYTGLRFSDFTNILPENIQGDVISIKTRKTGEMVMIPIHPMVRKIMDKYKDLYPNSLPPGMSNVKMNLYLKEIGRMMKCLHVDAESSITRGGVYTTSTKKKYELIQTHTARRSFATNMHMDGLSAITIMKITGHRSERQFMKYIKHSPKENAMIVQEHWKKKEKRKEAETA